MGAKIFVVILTIMVGVLAWFSLRTRSNIPTHLLGHKIVYDPQLLDPDVGSQLLELVKSMSDFPTNVADLKFYKTLREHIGEAQPIGADGKCDHPLLVPSVNRTLCVLPGRVDVGRHFIMSGGVEGLKESYEDMVTRVQSFGRYMFDPSDYPIVDKLFRSDKFQQVAKAVCPAGKQVLDPFQFNFIVQIPGQTVALHIDAPYFWGATRFEFPQWLLAVMVFSGLFQDQFIDQVQVVAYLHRWTEEQNGTSRGGEFVYWDSNDAFPVQPKSIPALPHSGSSVDGSKTIHAAKVYCPDTKPPHMDKSKENMLKYVGNERWQLLSGDKVLHEYGTNELRITIVYRARCFASESERERYLHLPDNEKMSLDSILRILQEDLVKRGRLSQPDSLSRLDLAFLLMDEYIKYPLSPTAWVPFNYCALARLWPRSQAILKYIC